MKIKKLCLGLLFLFLLCGCTENNNNLSSSDKTPSGQQPNVNEESVIKVVYFSCTNNTKTVATKIANYLNCPIDEIVPLIPYTADDLNYNQNSSRANLEQNDNNARPEIKDSIDLENVNTIFLGYPIWWGKLPKIIYTFLETYDLTNYKIIPFCTSGGSSIATSVNEIKKLEPNATILEGKRFNANASDLEVQSFVDSLKL